VCCNVLVRDASCSVSMSVCCGVFSSLLLQCTTGVLVRVAVRWFVMQVAVCRCQCVAVCLLLCCCSALQVCCSVLQCIGS